MTSPVVAAHRDTSLKKVAVLLDRHGIGGLPVVDLDDKVEGVISGSDLIRHQAACSRRGSGHRGRRHATRRRPAGTEPGTAGLLMTSPAVTVHPEARVADAARVMERHRIERLPVVDEEDRLIGIATRRDLLRVFLRGDEEIRRDVTDEVVRGTLGLTPASVAVGVDNGVVTLRGQVARRTDIPLAIRLAWRCDGVLGVVSRLTARAADRD
ncbi:CBS domain-containing protein [Streptomyces sp. VRA16 Mangrove soil]|nr:CBS domain-containing protein [Streptomyces sp. VRA16 Mangrove soil]